MKLARFHTDFRKEPHESADNLGPHLSQKRSIDETYVYQYLCHLRKAEGGLGGMNTTQAGDLVENLA